MIPATRGPCDCTHKSDPRTRHRKRRTVVGFLIRGRARARSRYHSVVCVRRRDCTMAGVAANGIRWNGGWWWWGFGRGKGWWAVGRLEAYIHASSGDKQPRSAAAVARYPPTVSHASVLCACDHRVCVCPPANRRHHNKILDFTTRDFRY